MDEQISQKIWRSRKYSVVLQQQVFANEAERIGILVS